MTDERPPAGISRMTCALRSRIGLLLAFGSIAAAAALWISRGSYGLMPLLVMSIAWLASVAAAVLGRSRHAGGAAAERRVRHLLSWALVASCAVHVLSAPGMYLDPAQPMAFRVLAVVAAMGASSYLVPLNPALARGRFGFIAACALGMGVSVLVASPHPRIDVWSLQQGAATSILHGHNPYAVVYPNVYSSAEAMRFLAPGMRNEAGWITAFPYPPLTFLLGVPAMLLFHDVRFMLLATLAIAAWALRRIGKGDLPELAALLLLLHPTTFFVLEQSWTEPIVLAALGATVVAMRGIGQGAQGARRGMTIGAAGGVLAAAKQYSPILAIPLALALPARARWRAIAVAGCVMLATLLPFVLWDAREFWHDVVEVQFLQPFRVDALSWLVPIAMRLDRPLSAGWGFLAAGAVFLVSLRPGSSLAHVLRTSAAAFLSFVLFNKQAFCNYYWLAVGLLLFATALEFDPEASAPSPE
jgi:hypothetical protein